MEEDIYNIYSKELLNRKYAQLLKNQEGKDTIQFKKKISRFEWVLRKEQSQMAISNQESIN